METPQILVISNDDFQAVRRHVGLELAKRMMEALKNAKCDVPVSLDHDIVQSDGDRDGYVSSTEKRVANSLFLALQCRHEFVRLVCAIAKVSDIKVTTLHAFVLFFVVKPRCKNVPLKRPMCVCVNDRPCPKRT